MGAGHAPRCEHEGRTTCPPPVPCVLTPLGMRARKVLQDKSRVEVEWEPVDAGEIPAVGGGEGRKG